MCLVIESTEMPVGEAGVDYCIDCHVPYVDEQLRCQPCADSMRSDTLCFCTECSNQDCTGCS